jgi:hypothetical protein
VCVNSVDKLSIRNPERCYVTSYTYEGTGKLVILSLSTKTGMISGDMEPDQLHVPQSTQWI